MTRLAPYAPPADADLSFDVMKWVMESHAIACSQVYGTLGAPYGAKNVTLTEDYVKAGTDHRPTPHRPRRLPPRRPPQRPLRKIAATGTYPPVPRA
jgi:hypothetical protein